ncbi:MAG: class I SAM-dependent methyltransferase [Anaerolineales bacterium]|nr:class I SAM-dependent methyltransferase [Anaerolineales bacterium]
MSAHDPLANVKRLQQEMAPTAVKSLYDNWANSYDAELEALGYLGPQMGAELLHTHLPNPNARILDAGCGTGLVGRWLHKLGYRQLHGADFSQEMLAAATKRGIYQQLETADFLYPLTLPAHSYDAVISIGVFGPRVPATLLDELVRLTKPGGLVCLSARVAWYEAHGTKQQIEQLTTAGRITPVAIVRKPYLSGDQAEALYCLLRVND